MTIKPLTIDNLGIEPSKAYAKNKEELDHLGPHLTEESRFAPKTEIPTTSPYRSAAIEEFLVGNIISWAQFPTPQGFESIGSHLFTHQLSPTLGPSGELQAKLDQLQKFGETLTQPEQQREYKMIQSSLVELVNHSRMLETINAQRLRYQRG